MVVKVKYEGRKKVGDKSTDDVRDNQRAMTERERLRDQGKDQGLSIFRVFFPSQDTE